MKADTWLSRILKLAEIGALIALALFLLALRQTAKEVQAEMVDLQKTTRDADAAVLDIQKRIGDTSQNLNAALLQIGLMTDEGRRASIEQRQYWANVSQETIAAVRDARGLIQASTAGVNQTTADLHTTSRTLNGDLVVVDSLLQSLEGVAQNLSKMAQHADENFAQNQDAMRTLKGMADTIEQLNKTVAHIEGMSADVQGSLHTALHPSKAAIARGMTWTLLKLGIAHSW